MRFQLTSNLIDNKMVLFKNKVLDIESLDSENTNQPKLKSENSIPAEIMELDEISGQEDFRRPVRADVESIHQPDTVRADVHSVFQHVRDADPILPVDSSISEKLQTEVNDKITSSCSKIPESELEIAQGERAEPVEQIEDELIPENENINAGKKKPVVEVELEEDAPTFECHRQIIETIRIIESFGHLKRQKPICVLIAGSPGTGKSFLTKLLASKMGKRHFNLQGSEAFSKWFGDSSKYITKMFKLGRKKGLVITVDEAEEFFSVRGSDADSAMNRVKRCLLTNTDGIEAHKNKNCLIICTSNKPETFDEAFLQRFGSAKFLMPLPTTEDRWKFTEYYLRKKGLTATVSRAEFEELNLEFFSFRELENVIDAAALDVYSSSTKHKHYQKIEKNPPVYIPCNCDRECNGQVLQENRDKAGICPFIQHRDVTIEDLKKSRKSVKPTSSFEEQKLYAERMGLEYNKPFDFEAQIEVEEPLSQKILGIVLKTFKCIAFLAVAVGFGFLLVILLNVRQFSLDSSEIN